tara:strand:+ start:652 stop:1098 length:447 start_codon:yes stop_codon:yes gene_type:complete
MEVAEMLLTDNLANQLIDLVRRGNFLEVACRACGISPSQLHRWLERGHNGEEPYRDLGKRLSAAQAEAEIVLVESLNEAASRDWKAAAWKLERKYPDRYGPRLEARIESQVTDERIAVLNAGEARKRLKLLQGGPSLTEERGQAVEET